MAFLKSSVLIMCVLGAAHCQLGFPRNTGLNGRGFNNLGRFTDDDVIYGDEIPGVAGVDYPVLAEVPQTGFSCDDIGVPGHYADQQSGCQVYYMCQKSGRGIGRLCPNGTVFNQEALVCDWWYNVDCARAVDYYAVNLDVVQAMEEVDAANGRTSINPNNYRRPVTGIAASGLRNPLNRFRTPNFPSLLQTTTRRPVFNGGLNNPRVSPFNNFNRNNDYNRNNNNNNGPLSPSKYTNDPTNRGDNNSDKEFNGYPYDAKNDAIKRAYLPPAL